MGMVEDIIKEKNLTKMDMAELDALVQSVLTDNEHIVAEYLAGKQKAMNALVGKVMEQAKLRADAKDVISILKTVCYGRELKKAWSANICYPVRSVSNKSIKS